MQTRIELVTDIGNYSLPKSVANALSRAKKRGDGRVDRRTKLGKVLAEYEREQNTAAVTAWSYGRRWRPAGWVTFTRGRGLKIV